MPNFMVVDLSHHNGSVDFTKARAAGVVGIIHKATEGATYMDRQYAVRRDLAKQAGLLWGAYHFGTNANVDAQAENFLAIAAPDDETLMALDFERNESNPDNSMTLPQARQFLQKIEAALGRKAVLYCGHYLKEELGSADDPYLAEHRLWWAQYAPKPDILAQWSKYWLWQYTDGAHGPEPHEVPGLGKPDCDTFDGTADELRAAWSGVAAA